MKTQQLEWKSKKKTPRYCSFCLQKESKQKERQICVISNVYYTLWMGILALTKQPERDGVSKKKIFWNRIEFLNLSLSSLCKQKEVVVLFVSKRAPCFYFLLFFIFLASCEPFSVFEGPPCDTVVDAENWCLERL